MSPSVDVSESRVAKSPRIAIREGHACGGPMTISAGLRSGHVSIPLSIAGNPSSSRCGGIVARPAAILSKALVSVKPSPDKQCRTSFQRSARPSLGRAPYNGE